MGHDITAFIRTKKTKDVDPKEYYKLIPETAYFRISAFNSRRRVLFYNMLEGSKAANGGVSGNGSILEFPVDKIEDAVANCHEFLSEPKMIKSIAEKYLPTDDGKTLDQLKELVITDVKDSLNFYQTILDAYNKLRNESPEIFIEYA